MTARRKLLTDLCSALALIVVGAGAILIAQYDPLPNDGYTGKMRVYSVVLDQPIPEDDQWTIQVEEIPTPAKYEPIEFTVDTQTRDYLVRGDILTVQDGEVVDVRYMDHTDVPGGEQREKVKTPYSEWTPAQMERERYRFH